ncbi:uncharacterized protein [Gossypium hirsutum]|uniref:Uncharacterized protein n=1 Tax=Gossypium hirsutum TaxID=3635 RepID=A0A1U8PB85_GOSHI|nr:uncharacterized protein LOC107956408 [Gossypium hirsutum]
MPNWDTSKTPVFLATETGFQSRLARDNTLSQAMLRVLEKVVGPHFGFGSHGSITKRLRPNDDELFKGVTRVTLTMAKYWLEVTKRIMNDIDCTLEQKLKGAVSLLRDEAYQLWLSVEGGKYVGASYVDDHRSEFMSLTQCDRLVAEYEPEFMRLSHYARGMVASKYEKCVHFENGLKDNLRILIAPQRDRKFMVLVDKMKIVEEVKRMERQNRDR